MELGLSGRRALVSGGSQGIGRAGNLFWGLFLLFNQNTLLLDFLPRHVGGNLGTVDAAG